MTEADADALSVAAEGSPDYPTLSCAMACGDCSAIFRAGESCPYCSSRSVLNLASILTPQPCLACGITLAECQRDRGGSCCITCTHKRGEVEATGGA